MKTQMSRVILFVSGIAKMTAFYRDVIGLPVIEGEGTEFVILDAGGCQLCLHQIPPEYDEQDPAFPAREDSYFKIAFLSEDIEADRAELIKKGVRMKEVVRFGDIALCDGCDPEGNIIQISSRI